MDFSSVKSREKESGFTLLEILVAVGIFAVLTGFVVVRFREANDRAKIAKSQSDLEQFKTAIEILYQDTGEHPGHITLSPCRQNPEVFLDNCAAGLICTDGAFANWDGPYISNVPEDPWGTAYEFDADYQCNGQLGCEGIPNGTWTRAVHSFGENQVAEYGGDDIASILCRE